jgi:hypothetical protein
MPRRTRDQSTKPRRTPSVLDRLNPDAAGIDCGSAERFSHPANASRMSSRIGWGQLAQSASDDLTCHVDR